MDKIRSKNRFLIEIVRVYNTNVGIMSNIDDDCNTIIIIIYIVVWLSAPHSVTAQDTRLYYIIIYL